MRIRLTKRDERRHVVEVEGERGEIERVELETRSLLLHDFLHYAVEEAAGLSNGFYARLAAGETLASLSHPEAFTDWPTPPASPDDPQPTLEAIEGVVGVLTRFAKGTQTAAEALALYERAAHSGGTCRPPWVDAAFLERVRARLTQLTGHWKALRFGEHMELVWPPPSSARDVPANSSARRNRSRSRRSA